MKQPAIFLFFLTLITARAVSQPATPRVSAGVDTLTVQINLVRDSQVVSHHTHTALDSTGSLFPARERLLDSLTIEHGEIYIYYHLPQRDIPKRMANINLNEVRLFYEVTPILSYEGRLLDPAPEYQLGDHGKVFPAEAARPRVIKWTHLLADYANLAGELTVILRVTEYSDFFNRLGIDCNDRAEVTFQQKWPHFAAGAAGGGLLLWALLEELRSREIYREDYRTAATLEEAHPFYEKANRKRQRAVTLAAAGTVILVADYLWYRQRSKAYRAQKKKYQYCPETALNIEPLLDLPSPRTPDGRIGLRFTYTFGQ